MIRIWSWEDLLGPVSQWGTLLLQVSPEFYFKKVKSTSTDFPYSEFKIYKGIVLMIQKTNHVFIGHPYGIYVVWHPNTSYDVRH